MERESILGFIIFILFLLGGALYYIFLAYAYSGRPDRKLAERKQNKQEKYEELKKKSNFRKVDSVQGILTVDGRDINTFNIGDLILDNTIGIKMYTNAGNGPVIISDIYFSSDYQSIIDGSMKKLSEQETTKLILDILNKFVNEGKVKRSTVSEVMKIFKEVKELNELIDKGRIKRENNEEETYICCY